VENGACQTRIKEDLGGGLVMGGHDVLQPDRKGDFYILSFGELEL
jgi:hypothetical protein